MGSKMRKLMSVVALSGGALAIASVGQIGAQQVSSHVALMASVTPAATSGLFLADSAPFECDPSHDGHIFYDYSQRSHYICKNTGPHWYWHEHA